MVDFFLKKYQWWICRYCLTRWKCQNQQLLPQLSVHVRRPWLPPPVTQERRRWAGGAFAAAATKNLMRHPPAVDSWDHPGILLFSFLTSVLFFSHGNEQAIPPPLSALGRGIDWYSILKCNVCYVHYWMMMTRNFGVMNMWFLLNPLGMQQSMLKMLAKEYYFKADRPKTLFAGSSNLKYRNPKYLSMLNHLRIYLRQVYPKLNKILFLDDDIVVQRDQTGWTLGGWS